MPMNYEELDDKTRSFMLKGFEAVETGGRPYRQLSLIVRVKPKIIILFYRINPKILYI
jgi:hypothetical protein